MRCHSFICLRFVRSGVLLSLALLAACKEDAKPAAPPLPEVLVQTLSPRDTPLSMEIVAEVKALREVELRPRVSGMLIKQNFKPGQKVKEGDLLFLIDPRAYDEAVIDAHAKLAEAEAVLARARQDVARYQPLLPDNAIPRQIYDQAVAFEQQNTAIVQAHRFPARSVCRKSKSAPLPAPARAYSPRSPRLIRWSPISAFLKPTTSSLPAALRTNRVKVLCRSS